MSAHVLLNIFKAKKNKQVFLRPLFGKTDQAGRQVFIFIFYFPQNR